ncbi:MAG: cytochrome c [Pseudomonadota bacterium]
MRLRELWRALLAFLGVLLAAPTALGQDLGQDLGAGLSARLGVTATAADYVPTIGPDGEGLPAGRGTVAEGAQIYTRACAGCHGLGGELPGNALVGGVGTLSTSAARRTVGSYWPFATTLFDYVRRAMPYGNEKSLSDAEVYAVTAYVLHLNGIIDADSSLDAATLPQVRMPNRDGFVSAPAFQPYSR